MRFDRGRQLRVPDSDGITSVPCERYIEESLSAYKMQDCKMSTSPKIEKDTMPEDEQLLDEAEASTLRSVVCRLLYLSSERPDIQSTVRALWKNLKSPMRGHQEHGYPIPAQ